MTKVSKRGYDEKDKIWFASDELARLHKAHEEIKWLLDRDYKMESVITFVCNKYLFTLRQRDALKRSTSSSKNEEIRKSKELSTNELNNSTLNVDGFNLIITLEVALSQGTLILGNDNYIRDLAGLRGTYKLIDKTELALDYLYKFLQEKNIKQINFYIDSPVSNSGRLKMKIIEYAEKYSVTTEVNLVNNVDVILEKLDHVVSGDAAILDKCISHVNIVRDIFTKYIKNCNIVNFIK